jgi:hypothetical protein
LFEHKIERTDKSVLNFVFVGIFSLSSITAPENDILGQMKEKNQVLTGSRHILHTKCRIQATYVYFDYKWLFSCDSNASDMLGNLPVYTNI